MLITHDPDLVDLVADTLWLVADGTVSSYDGDLDDYRKYLSERARSTSKADIATGAKRTDRRERADARTATAPLRKRVKDADARLAALAVERKRLEDKLASSSIYAPARKSEALAAQAQLAATKRLMGDAEVEWMTASEALEAAVA